MAPPAQAWDSICEGVLQFLYGWALIPLLATCKTARRSGTHLDLVQRVKQQVHGLNALLRMAIRAGSLRLPGFEAGMIGIARLIPVDPSSRTPGANMMSLLAETYATNPTPPTSEGLRTWLRDNWPEALEQAFDAAHMVWEMHTADNILFHNRDLERLVSMLSQCPYPAYSPCCEPASGAPVQVSGREAMYHPSYLLAWADCRGFPVLLYARAKLLVIPWRIVFASLSDRC